MNEFCSIPYTDKIEQIIHEFGLSYTDLAEKTGISYMTIMYLHTGHTKYPRFSTIVKLRDFTGYPLEFFFE